MSLKCKHAARVARAKNRLITPGICLKSMCPFELVHFYEGLDGVFFVKIEFLVSLTFTVQNTDTQEAPISASGWTSARLLVGRETIKFQ